MENSMDGGRENHDSTSDEMKGGDHRVNQTDPTMHNTNNLTDLFDELRDVSHQLFEEDECIDKK